MSTRATSPTAQALLGWMQLNGAALRALLAEEVGAAGDDEGPAGDPAIRAHLRFVARGLAEIAAPGTREGLEAFADGMPAWLEAAAPRLDAEIARVGEAHALEAGLQFGEGAGEDPSNRVVIERRVRVIAWSRVFLSGVGDALGPSGAGFADRATGWMAAEQERLADTIFAFDRRAKQAEIARDGPDAVADREVVNRIGQAAMLQGSVRFLVEAVAAAMDGAPRAA